MNRGQFKKGHRSPGRPAGLIELGRKLKQPDTLLDIVIAWRVPQLPHQTFDGAKGISVNY